MEATPVYLLRPRPRRPAGRPDRHETTEVKHFNYLSHQAWRNDLESRQADPGSDGHPPPRTGEAPGRGPGGTPGLHRSGADLYERPGAGRRDHRDHRRPPEADRPDRGHAGPPGVQLRTLGGSYPREDQGVFCGRLGRVAPRRTDRESHGRGGLRLPATAGRPCVRCRGKGGKDDPDLGPPGAAAGDFVSCARARTDLPKPVFRDELLAFGDRVSPVAPAAADPAE